MAGDAVKSQAHLPGIFLYQREYVLFASHRYLHPYQCHLDHRIDLFFRL